MPPGSVGCVRQAAFESRHGVRKGPMPNADSSSPSGQAQPPIVQGRSTRRSGVHALLLSTCGLLAAVVLVLTGWCHAALGKVDLLGESPRADR